MPRDALLVESASVSVGRRLDKPEKLERAESVDLGLRVFVGQRQATISSTDRKPEALKALVERVVAMARAVPEDPYARPRRAGGSGDRPAGAGPLRSCRTARRNPDRAGAGGGSCGDGSRGRGQFGWRRSKLGPQHRDARRLERLCRALPALAPFAVGQRYRRDQRKHAAGLRLHLHHPRRRPARSGRDRAAGGGTHGQAPEPAQDR